MVSSMREFDFIVIGSVTAGQKAAIQSAKSGKNVCLVETTSQVGGMCVHQGTILSKALRESAQRYMNAHKLLNTDQPTELPSLMANGDRVIQGHDEYISAQLKRISIDCIESRASFAAQVLSIHYDRTKPREPENIAIDHEHMLDSDSILSMNYLPHSMLVLAAYLCANMLRFSPDWVSKSPGGPFSVAVRFP